jgi:beta-lactamase class A
MNGKLRTFAWTRCATALGLMILMIAAQTAKAAEGIVNTGITLPDLYEDYIYGIGAEGWRPTRLNGYRTSTKELFATRWVKNTDNRLWAAKPSLSLNSFNTEILNRKNNGWRPIDVSGYNLPSGYVRFNSVWEKNPANVAWTIYKDQTLNQMTQLVNALYPQGWRAKRIEGYTYGGEPRYVSYWEYDPASVQVWHSRMTPGEYQANFDGYSAQGYRLISVDSYSFGGNDYYAAIWRKMTKTLKARTNRTSVPFQRYANNHWAQGYNFEIIYATDSASGATKYGGLWYYDSARPNTTLAEKVAKAVNSAPAVGGAYIYNETTGQAVGTYADRVCAIASSTKITILATILRDIDQGKYSWFSLLNSGPQMGSNGSSLMTANTNYTVKQLAEWMIAYSHNWASNVLIKKAGMGNINAYMLSLGLPNTRLNRYIMGTGAPSVHGNASATEDHQEGWENTTTPREMVTLLRKIWNDNMWSNTNETRFWDTMNLDTSGGKNTKGYCGSVANLFNPAIVLYNKAGNVDDVRAHRAEGGRMAFPDGQQVFYMICMDYISDDPDDTTASDTALLNAGNAIKDCGVFTAQAYY